MTDFARRHESLKDQHRNANAFEKAYVFIGFHLEWAAAVEATDPETAVRQYSLAEECQSTIGSGATSGGEGIASMVELYGIMMRRAEVLERMGRLKEALAVWKEIAADPNGLGDDTPASRKIAALEGKLRP